MDFDCVCSRHSGDVVAGGNDITSWFSGDHHPSIVTFLKHILKNADNKFKNANNKFTNVFNKFEYVNKIRFKMMLTKLNMLLLCFIMCNDSSKYVTHILMLP